MGSVNVGSGGGCCFEAATGLRGGTGGAFGATAEGATEARGSGVSGGLTEATTATLGSAGAGLAVGSAPAVRAGSAPGGAPRVSQTPTATRTTTPNPRAPSVKAANGERFGRGGSWADRATACTLANALPLGPGSVPNSGATSVAPELMLGELTGRWLEASAGP